MVNRSIASLFRLGAAAALVVLGTTALLQVTDAAPAAGANGGAAPATTASSSDPLYAWGTNYYGQLGDGTNSGPETCLVDIACSTTPVQVSLPSGVTPTDIAGGSSAGYALGSNGNLYAWGDNASGELGDGTLTDSSTPVLVSLPSGVTAKAIAGGFYNGYAIGSDGNLYAWGDNFYGELGNGTTTYSSTPVVVSLPLGVSATAIDGGSYNAFAIGSDGKLYAWGENIYGSLGDGAMTTFSSTPVEVSLPSGVTPKAIAGGATAYAIGSDGNLYAWGHNDEGQLGDGTSTGPQMCQDIAPPTPCSTIPLRVSLPSGVTPTAIAGDFTAFAIGSDGKLYAWGDNIFGLSLGNGSTTGPDTCVNGNPCSTTPVQVSLPSGITPTAIAAGAADGYAIGSDGNLYAWGDNSVGELGNGTTTGSSTPVVVSFPPGSTPAVLSTEPDSESAYAIGTIPLTVPTAVQQCKDGGWRTLADASGQPFKNQGQCISYAIHHPVSLSDLRGSLTGTLSLVGVGPDHCNFLEATFAATYPGSSAVGTVTLQMDGCVPLVLPPLPIPFAGTFALTTNVGALNGTVAGPITNVILPPSSVFPASATLRLTVTSGTGDFTGTTGTLNVSLQWPEPGSLSFIGTVSPA